LLLAMYSTTILPNGDFSSSCRSTLLLVVAMLVISWRPPNLFFYQVTVVVFYRYEEKLKERLARRRERLAQGLPVDDEDEEDIEDGVTEGEEVTDVKAILEDLDKRYIQTS